MKTQEQKKSGSNLPPYFELSNCKRVNSTNPNRITCDMSIPKGKSEVISVENKEIKDMEDSEN